MTRLSDRDKARLLVRAGLPVFTVLLCLLVVEVAARAVFSRPGMHFGIEMWKYAREIKTPVTGPMGHHHRPKASGFYMGAEVKVNSHGLRDRELLLKKPAGTYRILVLGDSTTLGWGVPLENTWTKLLEKALNAQPPAGNPQHFEVINAGVGNYNTVQEVAWFKERGHEFQPDAVWLAWFINDAEPTPRMNESWLAQHSYGYVWAASALDGLTRNLRAQKTYKDYYRGLYRHDQPGWQAAQAAFAELSRLCREQGVSLRLLLLPEMHALGTNYEFTAVHDLVRAMAAKEDAPALDLVDAFPSDADPQSFWVSPEDAHHNAQAMRRIAERIERALREERWIP